MNEDKYLAPDLTNCDREKIHLMPTVQSHGAFLAISPVDQKIRFLSENCATFFSHEDKSEDLIGRKLNELLSYDLAVLIQGKIREGVLKGKSSHTFTHKDQRYLDVYLYTLGDDLVGVEIEEIPYQAYESYTETLSSYLKEMQSAGNLNELGAVACRAVRNFTGYERVMVYRFFPPAMYGEVIAEDRVAEAQSFSDHRFPATDIPKPARDLYLRNQIRFIYDSSAKEALILPAGERVLTGMDLSDSRLRGVSRMHLEYLQNMEVASSFSVAIIVDDRLWGIIACHNSRPLYINHETRTLCFALASTVALNGPILESAFNQQQELSFQNELQKLFTELRKSKDPQDKFFRLGDNFLKLFHAQGLAYISEGKTDMYGLTPLRKDLLRLGEWLLKKMESQGTDVFCTSELANIDSKFEDIKEQASGVLCVKTSETSDDILIFLRPEIMQTVLWGGDPRKNLENREYQGEINPRASFNTWSEVVEKTSLPWKKYEQKGIQTLKDLIFDTLIYKEKLISELTARLQK